MIFDKFAKFLIFGLFFIDGTDDQDRDHSDHSDHSEIISNRFLMSKLVYRMIFTYVTLHFIKRILSHFHSLIE